MADFDARPGWRSYGAVLILIGETLLEGLKLPIRLVLFLKNRKAIVADLRRILTGKAR
jgi:hypothetical protein